MKHRIVFLDEYCVNGCPLDSIKALGDYRGYSTTLPEQVVERCAGADIVITNKVVFDDAVMASLPDLKLICIAATGMNNVDLESAARRGIEVRNAVGYSTCSVAEATLCAALALLRNVVYFDRYVHSGAYCASPVPFCFDLSTRQLRSRRWGIVGLGNIGREVARLAAAFGCEVVYASTSGVERQEDYARLPLEDLLRTSDVVSIHAPLNDHTRCLVGARELAAMKPSAIILNMARGGIIDEKALAEALDAGTIAGAATDVFEREPVAADNPLLHVRDKHRLLLSPHNAWSAVESIERLVECMEHNIKEFINL